MSDFKSPLSWMLQVFTKKQLEKIENKVDKLAEKEKDVGNRVGIKEHEMLRDRILSLSRNNELDIPFPLPRGRVVEHFTKITKNLFFTYPYYFEGESFVILQQQAKEAGFNVQVDPYASRLIGGNIRIVIWRPNPLNKKNVKK